MEAVHTVSAIAASLLLHLCTGCLVSLLLLLVVVVVVLCCLM